MTRMIDADALIERLDYCVKEGLGETIAHTFRHMIHDAPTIEPSVTIQTGQTWGKSANVAEPSGDLISRTEAKKQIIEKVFHDYTDEMLGTMQVLDELPSVSADAEWISVSEKLPNEDARYLVQMSYGIMQVLNWANNLEEVDDFDFYNKKHGGWYELDSEWGYCERNEVIAWMPLPTPYKGGDSE